MMIDRSVTRRPVHPVLWAMAGLMIGLEVLFAAVEAGLAPAVLSRGHAYAVFAFYDLLFEAALAGHVEIGDYAVVNAYSAVQQFVRIGPHVYLAAYAGATRDVVPFAKAHGNPPRIIGLNSEGLRRRGFESGTRQQLKRAFRLLFRKGLNTTQALAAIREEGFDAPEVEQLLAFIESSERGIVK